MSDFKELLQAYDEKTTRAYGGVLVIAKAHGAEIDRNHKTVKDALAARAALEKCYDELAKEAERAVGVLHVHNLHDTAFRLSGILDQDDKTKTGVSEHGE